MSAREDIARLLQQWLQMTRAESEAIQAAAWPRLFEIQSRKASLRQPLDEAVQRWNTGGRPFAAAENPFRADVARLIALESHNARLLSDRKQKVRGQRHILERASHNLRNVRRSYAPPPPVAWNSYS